MLIPFHWLSTLQLLALLAAGALVLASLLLLSLRAQVRPRLLPVLAVLGLWIIASALHVLKNRVHGGLPEWRNPAFKVVRNAESLALILFPLALAAFQLPRLRRACAAVLGLTGLALLILPGWAAVNSWNQVLSAQEAVMSIPGAGLLARDGHLAAGRWLWFLGAALMTVPTVRALLRRVRGHDAPKWEGMGWTLLGLGISSLAMGVFFWHQGDLRHRDVASYLMMLSAYAAAMLALSKDRVATARWAQHALGVFGLLIAVWMLTGVADGNFASGKQHFQDLWLTMLLLYSMLLIPPVLALHLLLAPIFRAAMKRLPATLRDRRAPRPD